MTKSKKTRPKILSGATYKMITGCGEIFVTVNEDEQGVFEIFLRLGKAGGCAAAQTETIGRLASLSFRLGGSTKDVTKQMLGIACHQRQMAVGDEPEVLSCADAIAKAIEMHIERGAKK